MQQFEEQDYTQCFSLSLWRKILLYAKEYYPALIRLCITMAVTAGCDVVFPLMTTYAIDHFIPNLDHAGTMEGMPGFIAVYLAILVIQVAAIFYFLYLGGKIEVGVCYTIRKQAFRKLQELPFSYYDRMPVGYLMSRMTSDTQRLAETIGWSLLDLAWGAVMLVAASVTMLVLNWKMALMVMLVVPPLAVVSWWFQQKILKAYRAVRKTNSQITGAFNEGIMGAMTTKTLVREEQNAAEFEAITTDMRRASIRASVLSATFFPLVISLGAIGTALALIFGGAGVQATLGGEETFIGVITAGTLVSFINYASSLFDPIQQLAGIFADMQSAQASAERVLGLLDTESEVRDTPEAEAKYGTTMDPKRENWEPIEGDITFDHVDFYYKESEPLLQDFNLHIRAGETVALVGETGAGKSTIVNLICRFYEPKKGRILIDGKDYRERSQLWLQSSLGYVLQQPHLFSGSIRDNIRFGCPDADEERVRRAAAMVHADEFIERQPKGYDTEVGEGGVRLSTGQKQLISFARVILANPQIFVLDEATSSIDTETEQLIQNAITEVLKGRTSIVVAHRLSTIRNADRILVIRDGAIVEQGDHETLLKLGGYYHDLYMHQYEEDAMQEALK